jgi:hypothetical protein
LPQPFPPQAQSYNLFQIGARVESHFRPALDQTNTGYRGVGGLQIAVLTHWCAVRREPVRRELGRNINTPSFTGNIEYALPIATSFSPYIIGRWPVSSER